MFLLQAAADAETFGALWQGTIQLQLPLEGYDQSINARANSAVVAEKRAEKEKCTRRDDIQQRGRGG